MATRTSWLRVLTPALLKSSWIVAFTAVSDVCSRAEISLLDRPSRMQRRTSRCLSVSDLTLTLVTGTGSYAFALTGTWGFQWAGIASDPVVDGFSGGAHLLDLGTGRTIEWISTGRWLAQNGMR